MSFDIADIARVLKNSAAKDVDNLSPERREMAKTSIQVAEGLESVIFLTKSGVWWHRTPLTANDDLSSGERAPAILNKAAIGYFSQSVVRYQDIDFFYIDALIAYSNKKMVAAGEALVADEFAGAFAHGIRMLTDGQYFMGSLFIVGKIIKLIILALLVLCPLTVAYDGHEAMAVVSLGGIGYILLSGHRQAEAFSTSKRKMYERIWSVNKVYALLNRDEEINWDLLARELSDARRHGVPWLSALDVAVSLRGN